MATTRVQPAEAALIFTGKQLTRNPDSGNNSKLFSFSMLKPNRLFVHSSWPYVQMVHPMTIRPYPLP